MGAGSTASDHFSFAIHGVPATYLGGKGGKDRSLGRGTQHTAADTFDKIPWTKLPVTLSMAARILLRMSTADPFPGRRFSADEVKKSFAADEEALRAQKEWPF